MSSLAADNDALEQLLDVLEKHGNSNNDERGGDQADGILEEEMRSTVIAALPHLAQLQKEARDLEAVLRKPALNLQTTAGAFDGTKR